MIVKKQAWPSLGSAPDTYSKEFFAQMIRTLQAAMNDLMRDPQPIKIVGLNYTGYPTSATGLKPGDVWVDTADGNAMKVVV